MARERPSERKAAPLTHASGFEALVRSGAERAIFVLRSWRGASFPLL